MRARAEVEIMPLNIRSVRQALGFSQKRMGEAIAEHMKGPGGAIPGTRINEWEMRVRAIPDYVFIACAGILVSLWRNIRNGKSIEEVTKLDPKLAKLLSPALASVISFEAEYRNRKDKEGVLVYAKAVEIRKEVQAHFESLLMIDLDEIFREESRR